MAKTIGSVLRRLRQEAGMPRRVLARMAKIDPVTLMRIEDGERKRVDFEVVLRLCKALDLGVEEFIEIVHGGRRNARVRPENQRLDKIRTVRKRLYTILKQLDQILEDSNPSGPL